MWRAHTQSPITVQNDDIEKAPDEKKNIKSQRIVLDVIKNHAIPHISRKENMYEMWDSLTKLYQISNEKTEMVLREKLKIIKMVKDKGMTTFLTQIT